MHVHPTLCCISCTQSSSVLRFKHALHGQNLLPITQNHGSNRNSQDDLNDERLFGSQNTNRNLIEEGNIVLGSNVNNSANNEENEIVFEDAPPVSKGTDDKDSNDEAQTPSNATMSFARQITWH